MQERKWKPIDVQFQLTAHLRSFAASANVTVLWFCDAVHLINATNRGSTVLLFVHNFWRCLAAETPEVQATTLQAIRAFVVEKYRFPEDAYTYFIEVPNFLENS